MSEQAKIAMQCVDCFFWHKIDMPAGAPVEIGAPKRGICHAQPPTPVPQIVNGQLRGQGHCRPMPMETEWCGMFTPREVAG